MARGGFSAWWVMQTATTLSCLMLPLEFAA
jgi:hypothetical protein